MCRVHGSELRFATNAARVGKKGERRRRGKRRSNESAERIRTGAKTKFHDFPRFLLGRTVGPPTTSYDIQFARKPTHHHASAWYIRVERKENRWSDESKYLSTLLISIFLCSYVRVYIYIYVGRKASRESYTSDIGFGSFLFFLPSSRGFSFLFVARAFP